MVADPDAMKHIFVTNSKNYTKGKMQLRQLKKLIGGVGLLSAEGLSFNEFCVSASTI